MSVAQAGHGARSTPSLRERLRRGTMVAIRDAAYDLIAERGFEAVTVDDIAAASGVARATFFNYFPTKLAVVQHPVPGEREEWLTLFERPTDEPLWDSVVAVLVGLAMIQREQTVKVRRLYDRAPELRLLVAGREHPFYADLHDFVRSRTRRGQTFDNQLLLSAALGISDAAFLQWKPNG